MKKAIVVLLLAVLACSMAFANGTAESAGATASQSLTKVKVAHHLGYSGAAVCAVGTKMGYFKDAGLDVELVPFTSGPSEVAALVSGDLQFGYIGSGATTLAVKGDVEIIYFQNLGDAEAIVVNKSSGIKSLKDLKGKTIATTLGTSGENVVNLALDSVGMSAADVNLINMDMGGCVTAMVAGKVDAVCVWGSYLVTIKKQLGENLLQLAKTSDFSDRYASVSSWLTTQKYIDEHPETVQAFCNALSRCFDYWKDNEEQVAVWVSEIVESDAQTIKDQIGTTFFLNTKELKAKLADGSIRKYYEIQQQSMLDSGKISAAVPIDSYVQWRFMEEAIKERNI